MTNVILPNDYFLELFLAAFVKVNLDYLVSGYNIFNVTTYINLIIGPLCNSYDYHWLSEICTLALEIWNSGDNPPK